MKSKIKLTFIAFISINFLACVNPAQEITGLYTGTFAFNGTPGGSATTDVKYVNTSKVQTVFQFNGGTQTSLSQVNVVKNGNDYTLSYSDGSGSFSGTVSGDNLNWSLSSGGDVSTFTGSK